MLSLLAAHKEIGQRCHTGLNPCCYQELLFTRKFTCNDIFFVACCMPLGCDVCVCVQGPELQVLFFAATLTMLQSV